MNGTCCGGKGNNGSGKTGAFLMGFGVALLGAAVFTFLPGLGVPRQAGAQVRSYPASTTSETPGGQPPTPTSTVEMLQRVVAALNETNERLARIEGRMDGEIKARVTNFPAAPAQNGK